MIGRSRIVVWGTATSFTREIERGIAMCYRIGQPCTKVRSLDIKWTMQLANNAALQQSLTKAALLLDGHSSAMLNGKFGWQHAASFTVTS